MPSAKKSPTKKVSPAPKADPSSRLPLENPLVFISHDSRDADLAEAFGNLLTDASGGILKSFRSSDRKGTSGIEYGQEWYRAIMQKLDDATDVVALLTERSLNRPWILYEAGVAKGKLTNTQSVLGLALGVTLDEAATGPFAQFQNSPDEEDAITGLVLQLIRRHPQADPREEAVRRQVKAFRETVGTLLSKRKDEKKTRPEREEENSVAKFFEEVKVLVRDVPERVNRELATNPQIRSGRKRSRIHPMMVDELFYAFKSRGDAELAILVTFSLIKDDFPWLYELGMELYRAVEARNSRAIEAAQRKLIQTAEMSRHPMLRELAGRDGEEMLFTVSELVHNLPMLIKRASNKPSNSPESKS